MDSFPQRSSSARPFTLSSAAEHLGVPVDGDKDVELVGIAPLNSATDRQLSPLMDRRYLQALAGCRASALLVAEDLVQSLPASEARPRLVVSDPHEALATLLEWLHPENPLDPEVHPTAVLGPGVSLGENVRIGPYAVIEAGATLGDGVRVGAHVVVGASSRIGPGCLLYPQAVVYPGTILERNVILHAGVRVGVDGFGYVFLEGEHRKVPQVGRCVVEEGVEVGANSTFDRGSIGDTRVGAGTKVDNLVQLGHNVRIGPRSIIVSQVGVAGSSELGAGVLAGGQAGIAGHLKIGDGAKLAAQAGVTGDVPAGETYMGFPARPRREFLRAAAAQNRLSDAGQRLRKLEREMEELRAHLDATSSARATDPD